MTCLQEFWLADLYVLPMCLLPKLSSDLHVCGCVVKVIIDHNNILNQCTVVQKTCMPRQITVMFELYFLYHAYAVHS